MKRLYSISKYFLIIFVIVLSTCNKDCIKFDRDLLTWIPYNIGDEIYFTNQNNDTLTFIINEADIYDDESYCRCEKCECVSYASFSTAVNIEDFINGEISVIENNIKIMSFGIRVGDSNGYHSLSGSNIFNDTISYSINNVTYNEVLLFEVDTILQPKHEIWKIIVANNYGVIKFYDRYTGHEWTLVE